MYHKMYMMQSLLSLAKNVQQSRERTELLETLKVHPIDELEAHARALVEAIEDLL